MNSILLNENNCLDVLNGIKRFPFRVSEIRNMHMPLQLSGVSFKYNLSGKELYQGDGYEETIQTGEYMLITNQPQCEVRIKEEEPDLGICIDLDPDVLKQFFQLYQHPNQLEDQNGQDCYLLTEQIFQKFKANPNFHAYMKVLFQQIKNKSYANLKELEYQFLMTLMKHQSDFFKIYKQIPVMKSSTRKELFRKMILAKQYMQDAVYGPLSLSELARTLCMSEFRLLHVYKSTFHSSPYHDFLYLKLQEAQRLYQEGHGNWTEIAWKLGFSDIQGFSKNFKKYMGVSPSQYQS